MKTHFVKSRTDPNKIYQVDIYDTFAECNCESFKFRHQCSHVKFILNKHYKKQV